jgi:hypothetical protein
VRLGIGYDRMTERIGAALNLVPVPIGLSMFGMPIARSLQIAQRTRQRQLPRAVLPPHFWRGHVFGT